MEEITSLIKKANEKYSTQHSLSLFADGGGFLVDLRTSYAKYYFENLDQLKSKIDTPIEKQS